MSESEVKFRVFRSGAMYMPKDFRMKYTDGGFTCLFKNYRLIKGTYMFKLVGFSVSSQDTPSDFFSEGAYKVAEIIGNKHENPELLVK